jgi:CDP-diglyceride synthetase
MVSGLLFLIVVSAAAPHSVHTSDAPAFFLLPLHINLCYIVAALSNLSNSGQKKQQKIE